MKTTVGDVKETVGSWTGNKQMETQGKVDQVEGRAEYDVAKATQETKASGEKLKGSVKDVGGKLLGDDEMRAEGKADKLQGNLRSKTNW